MGGCGEPLADGGVRRGSYPLRSLFVNENAGGHATFHFNVMPEVNGRQDVEAQQFDIPRDSMTRRVLAASVPVLGRWDADFALVRAQIAQSVVAAPALRR